jgi:murein DD-endopeptidase MepM/ murein hydrolase activator NlpD
MMRIRARRSSYAAPYHRHFLASVGLGVGAAVATVVSLSAFIPSELRYEGDELAAALPAPDGDATAVPNAGGAAVDGETSPDGMVWVTRGAILSGQTLIGALRKRGIEGDIIGLITREMAPHFNFRRAQPGNTYRLARDNSGHLLEFRYWTSEVDSYRLSRDGEQYVVRREKAALEPRPAHIAGVVSSNLYEAVKQLGESADLAADFADIFAWDVDFSRSVQPGDEFRIVYERLYRADDEGTPIYVRPGRILAAYYSGSSSGAHTAIYYEKAEGHGGYYRPDGTSVQRQFLVAPLRYRRISSSFSSARLHPILKVTRPHHGIDYAAPVGTPIWAVADGKVIFRGKAGGFGNLAKIRHANGYVSYYAHLSRFVSGLRVGQTVRQKQLIGYVGETGLTTGPHVCFRVAQDGRYVNPATLGGPGGEPVSPEARYSFYQVRDSMLAELGSGSLVTATQEAL